MKVHADLRWPAGTGIGVVQQALLSRVPDRMQVQDLEVRGRIGSPLSPLAISAALIKHRARTGAVFYSPGFMPPAVCAVPAVVTVHDLIHLRFYSKLHLAYYNRILRPLYRQCRAIICVSDTTRNEFLEWSGIAPERVFRIYNGLPDAFRSAGQPPDLRFPYVLYPGNRREYKNLGRLLQAYARSSLPRNGIHLVLTGSPDEHLSGAAAELRVGTLVHFAGNLSEAELVGLYRHARLVAFVSLYEGFGLPIIEAMASDVPVLTSNVSSMPEIAAGAAWLVDPYSVEAIAAGLDTLAFDESEREVRIRLGRSHVTQFDWDRAASQVWRIVAGLSDD
jgi:glycosyltransferase involved in cell wall biosynthesis